jgi:hypothetical protein
VLNVARKHTLSVVVMHIILGHVAIMLWHTAFILGYMLSLKIQETTLAGIHWLWENRNALHSWQ